MRILLILAFLVLIAASIPIGPSTIEVQTVKPDYKVIKYTFTRDNETDVMDQEPPNFQLIPLDFLCDFCQVVILKLKQRQAKEDDFEVKMRAECSNSTIDPSSLCDVINRVNLDHLKNDDPKEICQMQDMCKSQKSFTVQKAGSPAIAPNQNIGGSTGETVQDDVGSHLTIDEKNVKAMLNVEDPHPYN